MDAERNEVITEEPRILFDYLIVATGAQQAYFGHVDWAQDAPGPEDDRRRDLSATVHSDLAPKLSGIAHDTAEQYADSAPIDRAGRVDDRTSCAGCAL
jgi:hypothetical protein